MPTFRFHVAPIFVRLYWGLTLVLLVAALLVAAFYAPVESTMGVAQKIFYLHLPAAVNTFLAAFVAFVGAVAHIWTRRRVWDDLAHAAAVVTVVYCTVVLFTGMVWARSAWGAWWTWSPRLTFSLLLWLLYVVYLVLRPNIESPERRALICSVYAIVAFLDVPLVYLSVKLLPDIHPSSVALAPAMRHTLLLWFVPVTMLCAGLIAARFSLSRRLGAALAADAGAAPLVPVAGVHL